MPSDKDINLKLRFKRILFQMGYYSPIEVELSQYQALGPELKRKSLTDLDVLGIKFDPVLTPHKVICDCKSGRSISDPNRLFWLKGVMDYFEANIAYYLRPKIDNHARAIAPKLGVRAIDENELQALESNLNVNSFPLPLQDPNFYETQRRLWGISVPSGVRPTSKQLESKKVYTYLSYYYWHIEQHRNLFMLVAHFEKIAHLLDPDNPRDVLLAYVGVERFTHCLLEMGSVIYARGTSNLPQNARIYLYGGPLALRDREEFFRLLNKLTLVKEPLDPPFLENTIELVNRIVRNPYPAVEVLRYLEAIYGWCVQLGHKDIAPVFNGNPLTGAIVLSRDITITFAKATGMRQELYSNLLSL